MDLVMWGPGERLCGLGLATLRGEHVRFLEGDPRPGCPLRGKRTTVALETAFVYGQACGRREVRIVPVNTELETFYRDNFGFTLETPKGSEAYYRLEIPE